MEKKELFGRIEKLIESQKPPQEIEKAIDEVYKEYQDAYQRYLKSIQLSIVSNKNQVELNHIFDFTQRDYEEEREASKGIEEGSYVIKLDSKIKKARKILEDIITHRENVRKYGELQAIIDPEELTQEEKEAKDRQEDDDRIRGNTKTEAENMECAKQITENVLSEIRSSSKSLVAKISAIKGENENYRQFAKEEFLKEIDIIEKKTKLTLKTKVKESLDGQDVIIENLILDVFDEYRDQYQEITPKAKFFSGLRVEVNPQEAVKKVEEGSKRPKEQEKQSELEDLPGNVI